MNESQSGSPVKERKNNWNANHFPHFSGILFFLHSTWVCSYEHISSLSFVFSCVKKSTEVFLLFLTGAAIFDFVDATPECQRFHFTLRDGKFWQVLSSHWSLLGRKEREAPWPQGLAQLWEPRPMGSRWPSVYFLLYLKMYFLSQLLSKLDANGISKIATSLIQLRGKRALDISLKKSFWQIFPTQINSVSVDKYRDKKNIFNVPCNLSCFLSGTFD